MRSVTAGLIATGLCAWLTVGAVRSGPDVPARSRDVGQADPVRLADADDPEVDEVPGYSPPASRPHPRRDTDDRPPRGKLEGPPGRGGLGPRSRRPDAGHDSEPLSPEQTRRLMEGIRQYFPKLHERLIPLRKSNPVVFRNMLHRLRGPISEILRLKKKNPELAEKLIQALRVEMELAELQRQYHGAESENQREQIKIRLREQLEKRFDLRLERLRWEIRKLEERLEETKQQLANRENDKSSIIQDELDRLLKHKPDAPPGPRGPRPHEHNLFSPPPGEPS